MARPAPEAKARARAATPTSCKPVCQISDHAVLRYLERVWGIDVDRAKAEMQASSHVVDAAASFGCDTVKMPNGARLKLKGATVATVLPKRGY